MSFAERHYHDIRTMVRRCGGRLCRDRGWDVDDLTGDVLVAIVAKQESDASRFDAARGTPDLYLRRVVQSVISHWLERERTQARSARGLPLDVEPPAVDERGLDDEARARVEAILDDARRVLDDVAYRTLVVWLASDHTAIAVQAGLTRLDVLRYLAKSVQRLALRALPKWRWVWWAHRQRVYRQIQSERRAMEASPPPLKRVEGPRG